MGRLHEASERPRGAVYALTGEHGSGKTAVCTQVVADVRARGLEVAGIITGRSGPEPDALREVVDIRSGHVRLFGTQTPKATMAESRPWSRLRLRKRSPSDGDASGSDAPGAGFSTDPLTPRWQYESEVFAWANEVLSRSTPCDLLVVDEVGPLELLGGRGWLKAVEVLRRGDFRGALVVCRPSLLDELEDALGRPLGGTFEADLQETVGLPALIVGTMFA